MQNGIPEQLQLDDARSAVPTDLRLRTKQFAIRIVKMYSALPKSTISEVLGKQVLRSGTSIGANYREAYRARSVAEFICKMEICLQELEETGYWLELLVDTEIVSAARLQSLQKEADELTAIFVSSIKTAKLRRK